MYLHFLAFTFLVDNIEYQSPILYNLIHSFITLSNRLFSSSYTFIIYKFQNNTSLFF